jgi:hypothetical protein
LCCSSSRQADAARAPAHNAPADVRFAPENGQIADIAARPFSANSDQSAAQQSGALFDHLVGDGEQLRRNVEAERSGSLKIDHKFKFGRLNHRKIRGLLAL